MYSLRLLPNYFSRSDQDIEDVEGGDYQCDVDRDRDCRCDSRGRDRECCDARYYNDKCRDSITMLTYCDILVSAGIVVQIAAKIAETKMTVVATYVTTGGMTAGNSKTAGNHHLKTFLIFFCSGSLQNIERGGDQRPKSK